MIPHLRLHSMAFVCMAAFAVAYTVAQQHQQSCQFCFSPFSTWQVCDTIQCPQGVACTGEVCPGLMTLVRACCGTCPQDDWLDNCHEPVPLCGGTDPAPTHSCRYCTTVASMQICATVDCCPHDGCSGQSCGNEPTLVRACCGRCPDDGWWEECGR